MATTLQIKIPATFTDAGSLPVVRADPFLSPGSLVMIDPTNPANPWPAGAPAHNATVPNLAWQQAAALIGSGSEASLASTIYNVGMTGAQGKVERTTKGGIHGIISPTFAFTDATVGFNIAVAQAIYDYVKAHGTHQFYVSMWHWVTRASSFPSQHVLFSTLNADTQFAAAFSQNGTLAGPGSTAMPPDARSAIDETVGVPLFRNAALTPGSALITDANTSTLAPGPRSLFLVGNRHNVNGAASSGARRGKGGSRSMYRYVLDDLTAWGGTYAERDALDRALFAAYMSTPGGRYYGDTIPTDPATIP